MSETDVDFRFLNKGFTTKAALLSALSGAGNAGKAGFAIEGTIITFAANSDGTVQSFSNVDATLLNLQEQINSLSQGGTLVNFRYWNDDQTYGAGDIRAYYFAEGDLRIYQSQQPDNTSHAPGGDDGYWWLELAAGATVVGDLFEWLSKTKANA